MKKTEGNPLPFGAAAKERQVNFSVQVPMEKECQLLLYKVGSEKPEICYDMPREEGIGEVRFLSIQDLDPEKYEYNFRIGGKVCTDPYAKEIAGREVFGKRQNSSEHGLRGKIQVSDYDWEGDRRICRPWNEVVAYSIHVRGFTKHSSSKALHKGTYRGVIEKIPYLKELGINQIQCMPIYEFDECVKAKINYWGYGPAFYFAPKEAYASDGRAAHELKDMVKACHKAEIEVVLEMPFAAGISEQKAAECLRFYMMEYHVDGFVVNPYVVSWEFLKKDPFLKEIRLIRKDDGFQNVMRRFLKGDENMVNDVITSLSHNSATDGRCNYITAHTGFTLRDLVSYDCKHNEENGENNMDGPDYNYSWNCGAEGQSRKRSIVNLRKSQIRNAFLLLLLAQGTPCLLAGDEFYNTQKGNNNVYCQDNAIGWLDWSRLKSDRGLFDYVKALIAFRKEHPCLCQAEELKGLDRTACGMPDVSYHGENAWQVSNQVFSRQLGVLYSGTGKGDCACFIAYNMHWIPHTYALPSPGKGKCWHLALDTDRGVLSKSIMLEDQKCIEIRERSIAVLLSCEDESANMRKSSSRGKGRTTAEKQKSGQTDQKKDTEKGETGVKKEDESGQTFSNDHKA